mmetsp:Transcript_100518/g.255743  ORF Transcript_100518/g.255743 Transcript_100518/m.255743 type:complete len:237 (-) Transcript_100518:230-940(-)
MPDARRSGQCWPRVPRRRWPLRQCNGASAATDASATASGEAVAGEAVAGAVLFGQIARACRAVLGTLPERSCQAAAGRRRSRRSETTCRAASHAPWQRSEHARVWCRRWLCGHSDPALLVLRALLRQHRRRPRRRRRRPAAAVLGPAAAAAGPAAGDGSCAAGGAELVGRSTFPSGRRCRRRGGAGFGHQETFGPSISWQCCPSAVERDAQGAARVRELSAGGVGRICRCQYSCYS